MIDKIHEMVFNDRRIKVREIVEATGISKVIVFLILHKKFKMPYLFFSPRYRDSKSAVIFNSAHKHRAHNFRR